MSETIKVALSWTAAIAMGLSVPTAVYFTVDEGIFGAEHSNRTSSEAVIKMDQTVIKEQVKKAQKLAAQKAAFEQQWSEALTAAAATDISQENAFAQAKPARDNILAAQKEINNLTIAFKKDVFGNRTLSEEFLQNAMYDFRQALPDSGINEDQARRISECQPAVGIKTPYQDIKIVDVENVNYCTERFYEMRNVTLIYSLALLTILGGLPLGAASGNAVNNFMQRREDKKAAKKAPRND